MGPILLLNTYQILLIYNSALSNINSLHNLKMPLLLLLLLVHLITAITSLGAIITKPGCPEKCGNIIIPYPFGMGKGCYLNRHFEITCNMSFNPPRPLLLQEVQLLQISEDYLRVAEVAHRGCFSNSGKTDSSFAPYNRSHHFSYSHTRNNFIAIGCDIFAYITENSTTYASGCASLCPNSSITAGFSSAACSGIGCCRANFQKDISWFNLRIRSINMITPAWRSMPCGLAFIAESNFSIHGNINISREINKKSYVVPAILDWSVGNMYCPDAIRRKNYACGQNTDCVNSSTGQGYKCRCLKGYQGNPYLSNGCKDINECKDPVNTFCHKQALCTNINGNYSCTCPAGYRGDGKKHGTGCTSGKHRRVLLAIVFSLGAGIIIVPLILLATGWRLYRKIQEREKKKIKEKFFKKNGGLLLQQQISSSKESVEKTKLYSIEELEKATDGFNSSRIIGKGGLGTVYKGMLSDGRIVAIKKSNTIDEKQVEQFVNEVLILSQINHRHIVKLLGCCLETEVPLLVYEYVSNGTLSHHLHNKSHVSTISWKNRLRIAGEVAGALAYLHSYASIAICHRDIKSSNILLDENLKAVVSDFGLSRSIPLDKTHLTALVQGTFGYLDPDYFRSGQFTDKSDVYAFGVVLAELLTGEKAISFDRFEEGLANYFRSSMKQNRLLKIIDNQVANEGQQEEIYDVARITKRCLKSNGKKRPTMKQVEIELQQLGRFQEQFSFDQKTSIQDQSLHQQIGQDYCSVSERSHSYTFSTVIEETEIEDDQACLS